jgi:hypothetical protein
MSNNERRKAHRRTVVSCGGPANKVAETSTAAAEERPEFRLFARREKYRQKLTAETERLLEKHKLKLKILDFPMPRGIDRTFIRPLAQRLADLAAPPPGASLLYVCHPRGRKARLGGFLCTNKSGKAAKLAFAETTGVRLASLHVRRPKRATNIPLRVSRLVVPALSLSTKHPRIAVATGVLRPIYEKAMTRMSQLAARMVTTATANTGVTKRSVVEDSSNVVATSGSELRCQKCKGPIVGRRSNATYCKECSGANSRKKHRTKAAKAQAQETDPAAPAGESRGPASPEQDTSSSPSKDASSQSKNPKAPAPQTVDHAKTGANSAAHGKTRTDAKSTSKKDEKDRGPGDPDGDRDERDDGDDDDDGSDS